MRVLIPKSFICANCNLEFIVYCKYAKCYENIFKKYCSKECGREGKIKALKLRTGDKNSFYGRTFSEESIKKLSKAAKLRTGDKNSNYGNKWTDEQKKNMSIKTKGRKVSEQGKKNISEGNKKSYENGNRKIPAKFCDTKPELKVESILIESNINYVKQKRIETRTFDFYLPDFNMLVEVDGKYYHNYPFGTDNDIYKNNLAKRNGYRIVRIWNGEEDLVWRIV